MFLLPSAHTSNDPKACADSCAAALEISRLAVEWSPGGARALTASEIGDVRAHAEALVCDPVSDPEDVNEALFALEQAASTHQVAAAFSGVQVSVPVLRTSRAGGGFTWSPLFDEFSGRVTAVMRSLAVGGGGSFGVVYVARVVEVKWNIRNIVMFQMSRNGPETVPGGTFGT